MVPRISFLWLGLGLCPAQEPQYYARSTTKLFQLTGDFDRPRQLPTRSLTRRTAGVNATDLGSSFEHKGKLYFLFGDTWGGPRDTDVLAFSEASELSQLRLHFHLDKNGKFLPLRVPGVRLTAFEIPSYGISVGGEIYVVFTTDHNRPKTMGRSVMAVSKNDGRDFKALYDLSTLRFINVAMAHAKRGDWPGLPVEKGVLVYGSGQYRHSSPRLAVVPASGIHKKKAFRYLEALEAGRPGWSRKEERATVLFDHPVVGEFSVAWVELLERWVMLYNSSSPRGIVMRTAKTPWGPWPVHARPRGRGKDGQLPRPAALQDLGR